MKNIIEILYYREREREKEREILAFSNRNIQKDKNDYVSILYNSNITDSKINFYITNILKLKGFNNKGRIKKYHFCF